ncbi:SusC/RagA family TonB-linked outer membrane protein [Pedobacter xixiisoli]|uniref:TonB-linked outer membrane protein, SusC/RagA family n=1 Tax=Pedobacter xixiisoli TaxID=1476464 RepID=A0A286A8G8_9SPHI|nr:SusC/RagA family TonB-linked outer membrane protein [Pedobacter xixiisoli]SOD18218.1 TonB-linked outer membrane protein, SusC/RagA family [Pedobacter xixiisoli]
MYKKIHCDGYLLPKKCRHGIIKTMKVTVLLMFAQVFAAVASVYSQDARVSLNINNQPLSTVISTIKEQTSYSFFFDAEEVDVTRKISISGKDIKVKDALEKVLKPVGLETRMSGNHILIIKKEAPAQQKEVRGVVKDDKGLPIGGASVAVKGTSGGALTDANGNFRLLVPSANSVLVISYIGMKTLEMPVGTETVLNITLQSSEIVMQEVVVTALGIKKEARSLSYHVQQLSANEVNRVSDANFVNNLNGKVAGVTINSSSSGVGGSSRVIMRGVKSISGNNNALYVIDGVPMPNLSTTQPEGVFAGAGQTGDGISNINPEDIESISVLSGPSAAALYGSSAANGVVLVTTKKGVQGKLSLNLSNSTTFSSPLILPEFQNTYGQTEQGSYYSWGDKLATPSSYNPSDFFQTGSNVTNSVSLSTGTAQNQTYFSAGTVNAQGIIHNNDYTRLNFSVRNTSKFLDDKMTMDLGFMTSNVKEQNMISQGLYFNPLVAIYLFPAGDDFAKVKSFERYNASRNFQTQFWPYGDQGLSMQNPYWVTERNLFMNDKGRYMANGSVKYEFANWINLSARAKIDKSNDRFEKKYYASTNTLFASDNGYYSLNGTSTRQVYGEALLNINKNFNDNMFGLTANIGASIEDVKHVQDMFGGRLHGVANLFTSANVNRTTSEYGQSGFRRQKNAVFASSQLGYKSMAYLDVTARNDWASTLAGSDVNSFFYPTVGLSGIMTDIFPIKSNALSYLKLRVSYSEVGNEPNVFLTIPTYLLSGRLPNTRTRMPNTDLVPERTKSWEAGANLMLFKSKLKLDATVYKSSTYNQFFEPTLSSSSGFTSVIVNAGQVDNKGIEVSARYSDKFGKLNWTTGVTYSLNRNKIIALLPGWVNPLTQEVISLSEVNKGGTASYRMILKEGGTMGDIYVNTLRTDEHGAIYVHPSDQVVVADANNFVRAGNTNPKYNLAWNNSFDWNGLSLGFLFTGRVGGIVVSNTQAVLDAFGASKASADARDQGGALVNGYRIPAREYYQTVGGGSSGIGSMYTYSATNVRLAELSLGYNIPIEKWTKTIKGLNVSMVGRNLFFLYNKAPFDPELTANTSTYYQGIDYFMQPSLRNLGFSVKVQF